LPAFTSFFLAVPTVVVTALPARVALVRTLAAVSSAVDTIAVPILPAVSVTLSAACERIAVTPLPLLMCPPDGRRVGMCQQHDTWRTALLPRHDPIPGTSSWH